MSIRIEFADNPDHPDVWRDIISTLFSFDLVIVVEYQTWTEGPSWVLAVTSFCLAHVTPSGVTSENPHTLYTITKDTPKSNSWRKQTHFEKLICLCGEFNFYASWVTFAESKCTPDLCKEKTTFQMKASGVRRSFQIWQLQLLHCQALPALRCGAEDLIVSSEIFFVATFASLPHCHIVQCGKQNCETQGSCLAPARQKEVLDLRFCCQLGCDMIREDSDMWRGLIESGWDLPEAREMEGLRWKSFRLQSDISNHHR